MHPYLLLSQKSLKIMEATFKNDSIQIDTEYNSHNMISMHTNEMVQVIVNILKNSQDNFQEKNIKNPIITIKTYEDKGKNTLEIGDNGGGIRDDVIHKIFDPYFSTKSSKNGTGLGLYMSRLIVEKHHGGKLKVRNKDNGVLFSITL